MTINCKDECGESEEKKMCELIDTQSDQLQLNSNTESDIEVDCHLETSS